MQMTTIAKLASDMLGYGRAKEAVRLFSERPRYTIMFAMMLAAEEDEDIAEQSRNVHKLVLEGKVNYMGTLIEVDKNSKGEFTPLLLAHRVYANPAYEDVLYDPKDTLIEVGKRTRESGIWKYLDRLLQERKMFLFRGVNCDLEVMETRYLKQVLKEKEKNNG